MEFLEQPGYFNEKDSNCYLMETDWDAFIIDDAFMQYPR